MLKRRQIKAARELLGWSKEDCALHAGVTTETMRHLELETERPLKKSLETVSAALEKAGVRSGERGKLILEPPTGGARTRG